MTTLIGVLWCPLIALIIFAGTQGVYANERVLMKLLETKMQTSIVDDQQTRTTKGGDNSGTKKLSPPD